MKSPIFPEVRIPVLDTVTPPPLMRVRLPQPKGEPVADIEGTVSSGPCRRDEAKRPAGRRPCRRRCR